MRVLSTGQLVSSNDKLQMLQDLVKNVEVRNPSQEDLTALRRFMEINPEVWVGVLGLAARVERRSLIVAYPGQEGLQAQCASEMAVMRRALGADEYTDPLERLLIERLILCWFRLQYVEEQASYTMLRDATTDQAEHWDKRLTRAQQRFLRASEALARVRRLNRKPEQGMSLEEIAAAVRRSATAPLHQALNNTSPESAYDAAGRVVAKRRKGKAKKD